MEGATVESNVVAVDTDYLARELAPTQGAAAGQFQVAHNEIPTGWSKLESHGRVCQSTSDSAARLDTSRAAACSAMVTAAETLAMKLSAAAQVYEDVDLDAAAQLEKEAAVPVEQAAAGQPIDG